PGVVDSVGQRLGVARGQVKVLRGKLVDTVDNFALVASQDQGAEVLQRLTGQVATRQGIELLLQRGNDRIQQRLIAGDEDARTGGVLGLGDQVAGDKRGRCALVGNDNDLTGAGKAVDGDLAEDVSLGQGDEQVAGADDHIDGGQPLDAVGQGRDG